MRLVRREDARGVCLVLLRFCDAETAAGFYENYNGRPVRLYKASIQMQYCRRHAHDWIFTSKRPL